MKPCRWSVASPCPSSHLFTVTQVISRLVSFYLPPHSGITDLKLIQVIAVFSVLHHPSKHQQPRPIAHEAVGSTARRNVAAHCRNEPLVGGCRRGGGVTGEKYGNTIKLSCIVHPIPFESFQPHSTLQPARVKLHDGECSVYTVGGVQRSSCNLRQHSTLIRNRTISTPDGSVNSVVTVEMALLWYY